MWAKQSTAATLIVGPILDSAGAEYASAVIGDLSISKNGGTLTALASAATLTHIANGQYTLVMTTGNLDTLGRLQITCNKSTYQMPPIGLNIVPAMVFDSMILGTDVLQSDVTQFGGTNLTAAAGIPEVKVASIANNAITAAAIQDAAIGTATFATGTTLPRVTLVDTCTTNSDMRGTDNAALAATALSTAVWTSTIAGRIDAAISSRLAPLVAGRDIAVAATTGAVVLDPASRAAILTQELIESYAADGAAPTVAQALMMLLQHHQQKSVSGTTVTIKKLDKSTTAGTYTLDSATDPTSITRAT